MAEKKRYLVGYRHAATVPKATESALHLYLQEKGEVRKLRALTSGHHVLEMTEEEAEELARKDPLLIIEEDKELEMFLPMPGLGPGIPSGRERTVKIRTVDGKTDAPVEDVTLYCSGAEVMYRGITDRNGSAELRLTEDVQQIIASPRQRYWSKLVESVASDQEGVVTIALDELPAPAGYSPAHLALRIDKVAGRFTGKGIKIGVIDSGIADHEDLRTKGGYNALDGQAPESWNQDEKGHGTHCAGTMAAINNDVGVTGVAPDAEIYSLKVFPGGRFSDLVEAINWCVENYMDVISMSLGSSTPSPQVEMALAEAVERGITCVAAAGNSGGEVAYPAAHETVIAVSALGELDSFPADSAHALRVTDYFSNDGKYFFASFSNYGPEIDLCAPGVAVLSTVPTGYAAWDGTSMAAPFVAGLAALVLEGYPEIRTGDVRQSESVRAILQGSAIDLGLPAEMQGAGLPNAALALRDPFFSRIQEEATLAGYRGELEEMLERARACSRNIEQSLEEVERMMGSKGKTTEKPGKQETVAEAPVAGEAGTTGEVEEAKPSPPAREGKGRKRR